MRQRTGDTPSSKRQRQRRDPPQILLTTPEQLALVLASPDAPYLFGSLRRIVLDELHALVTSKRGDLLSLGLARLFMLAPDLTSVGLSATVAEPDDLAGFLVPQPEARRGLSRSVVAQGGAAPRSACWIRLKHLPGRPFRAARDDEVYGSIKTARHCAHFRQYAQPSREGASRTVAHQRRWARDPSLRHGSLDVTQRRKVEAAMAARRLPPSLPPPPWIRGRLGDIDLVVILARQRRLSSS